MYLTRGETNSRGPRGNPNSMFRVPLAALGSHCLSATGIGNAQAALDLTIEAIKERSTNYTGTRMRDFQAVQLCVARGRACSATSMRSPPTSASPGTRKAGRGR